MSLNINNANNNSDANIVNNNQSAATNSNQQQQQQPQSQQQLPQLPLQQQPVLAKSINPQPFNKSQIRYLPSQTSPNQYITIPTNQSNLFQSQQRVIEYPISGQVVSSQKVMVQAQSQPPASTQTQTQANADSEDKKEDQQQEPIETEQQNDQNESLQDVKQGKIKAIMNQILYFLPILFALFCLIGSFFLLRSHYQSPAMMEQVKRVLEFTQQNLNMHPIKGLVTVPKDTPCPQFYNQISIGYWPGIHSGCLCSDGGVHSKEYCLDSTNQCQFFEAVPQKPLSFWKNGLKICARTNEGFAFTEQACYQTQQSCFPNLCIQKDDQCPFNELIAFDKKPVDQASKSSSTSSSSSQPQHQHYSSQRPQAAGERIQKKIIKDHDGKLNHDDLFYLSSDQGQWFKIVHNNFVDLMPFVDIMVTPGGGPCFDSKTSPFMDSHKYFPLDVQQASGCDKLYGGLVANVDTVVLDEMNLMEFAVQNGYADYYTRNSIYYSFVGNQDNTNLVLVRRLRTRAIPQCEKIDTMDVSIIEKFVNHVRNACVAFCIIIILASIFILFMGFLFKFFSNKFGDSLKDDVNQRQALFIMGLILAFIVIILGCVYFYYYETENEFSGAMRNYKQYTDNQCFANDAVNIAIKEVLLFNRRNIDLLYGPVNILNWAAVLFIVIMFGLLMLKLFIFYYDQIKEKELLVENN